MGPLELKPKDFWSLTWGDLNRMILGYKLKQEKGWEIARWQVCVMLNTKIKKGAKPLKPSDLMELSIDKKDKSVKKIKRYTPEEIREIQRKHGTLKNG